MMALAEGCSRLRALQAHGVRAHVTMGGSSRSATLAKIASVDAPRRAFYRRLARFVSLNRLPGVIIDWTRPPNAKSFQGAESAAQEARAYASLLQDLRAALREADKGKPPDLRNNATLGVTLVIPVVPSVGEAEGGGYREGGEATSGTALSAADVLALRYADRIHLMAYDNWSDPAGHSSRAGAFVRVQAAILAGIPPRKLLLGIPFYGRRLGPQGFSDVHPYHELLQDASDGGGELNPTADTAGGGEVLPPYAFNGRATVFAKSEWARAQGLGGVFAWELRHDALATPGESLLAAMAEVVSAHTAAVEAAHPEQGGDASGKEEL